MRSTIAILLLASVTTLVALPDYEPFNYTAGTNLVGNTNDNGLFWTAAGPAGTNVTVVAGNLNVFGLSPSAGNSIQINAAAGPSARMGTEFTVTSGTFYYSFAFRVANLTGLSASGGYIAAFNNSRGTQSTTPSAVGAQLLLRAVDASTYNVGLSKASTAPGDMVWSTQAFTTNETVFVVGSYTFNTNNTADDVANLWVNPDVTNLASTNPAPPTLIASTGTDITSSQIASFVFFQRTNTGVQPLLTYADELRLGRTFADVTPTNAVVQSCAYPVCPGGRAIVQCLEFTNRSYDIYLPPQYSETGPALPILYTFHPNGGGMVANFGGVCSDLGVIVVGIRESSNAVDWFDFIDVIYAVTRDIRQRLRFDPTAEFTTGWSGGGNEAYIHSQVLRQEIGGVYAMCSWIERYSVTDRYLPSLLVTRGNALSDATGLNDLWAPDGSYMDQLGIKHYDTWFPGGHAIAPDTNKFDCLNWLINHRIPAGTNDESIAAAQAATWRAALTNGETQRVFTEAFNTVMTNPRSYLENQAQLIVDTVMKDFETFRTFTLTNLTPGDLTADYLYYRAYGAAKIGDTNTYFCCLKAYMWLTGTSGDRDDDVLTLISEYGAPPPKFTCTFSNNNATFTYAKDAPVVNYVVQQNNDLSTNFWTNLPVSETANMDGTFSQTVTNDNSTVRFFRMALQ